MATAAPRRIACRCRRCRPSSVPRHRSTSRRATRTRPASRGNALPSSRWKWRLARALESLGCLPSMQPASPRSSRRPCRRRTTCTSRASGDPASSRPAPSSRRQPPCRACRSRPMTRPERRRNGAPCSPASSWLPRTGRRTRTRSASAKPISTLRSISWRRWT